ncbi:MAG: hypothetical protein LBS40_07685 [Burkholderiales bacterium]|nr:hypothetical protein [Burkholderiales bacterium]
MRLALLPSSVISGASSTSSGPSMVRSFKISICGLTGMVVAALNTAVSNVMVSLMP